jgi:hypothetical protein
VASQNVRWYILDNPAKWELDGNNPEKRAYETFAGRLGAGYVSPESAALAAVPALLGSGEVKEDDEVVIFDCGIGQKYPPPPGLPVPQVVDPANFDLDTLADQIRNTTPSASNRTP